MKSKLMVKVAIVFAVMNVSNVLVAFAGEIPPGKLCDVHAAAPRKSPNKSDAAVAGAEADAGKTAASAEKPPVQKK